MPEEINSQDIDETSEELSEIIGKVPGKIFSYVVYIVLGLIAIGFASANFINYPEKRSGKIMVYNASRPLKIICQQNIQLVKLFVQDGQVVRVGANLAMVNNTTDYDGVIYLKKLCSDYDYVFENTAKILKDNQVKLSFGDIQPEYNAFIDNLYEYHKWKLGDNKQGLDTERLRNKIFANLRNIEIFTRKWDEKYLIKAVKAGRINYIGTISEGQYYKTGDELFSILMPNKGLFGVAYVPGEGVGNISLDQKARIKLSKYPFIEYGYINGHVTKINAIPVNNFYEITLKIDSVDNKILKEKLVHEEEASGDVDIIIRNYSLTDRLLMNIRKIMAK